jgi:membrane protease YdiL (CAAX protease family)
MKTTDLVAGASSPASLLRLALVFAALFMAYQLPEGLGLRVLHSVPAMSVLMLLFFPVAWLAGRALGYRGFDAWYMSLTRNWGLLLAAAFVLAVLAKAASVALGGSIGIFRLTAPAPAAGWALLLAGLGMLAQTFFPSVAEDIVTRGFLMRALPAWSKRWVFVIASAGLYLLNHIYRLGNGPAEWLMLFCFGLAYGAALFYSHSLWPAIGLHWGWNFAGGFGDELVSVDVLAPDPYRLLSAAAHLAMLGVVVLVARQRAKTEPGAYRVC